MGFKTKKKYGQNFITDKNMLNKIVNAIDINSKDLIIEIGLGLGTLTRVLTSKAHVLGYEIDYDLNDYLKDIPNLSLIYKDFLKSDINEDIGKLGDFSHIYVVANLPYYITTPIINKIIEERVPVDKMVLMMQKEVANRITASTCTKDYNSLTIFINYFFKTKKLFDVSRNVFDPKPNVDSSVVLFEKKEEKEQIKDLDLFFRLVRDSFRQKRKNLKNNLKDYNLVKIGNILEKYNLDLTVRAEQLSIDMFIDITNNL